MKQKHYIIIIIFLIGLNIFSWRFWWERPLMDRCSPPNEERVDDKKQDNERERGFHFLIKKLNLSDQQRKDFKDLRRSHFRSMKEKKQTLEQLRGEFEQLVLKGDTSYKKQDLYQDIAETKYDMEMSMFNHFDSVRALCTEEQKLMFDTILCDVVNKATGKFNQLNENRREKQNKKDPIP